MTRALGSKILICLCLCFSVVWPLVPAYADTQPLGNIPTSGTIIYPMGMQSPPLVLGETAILKAVKIDVLTDYTDQELIELAKKYDLLITWYWIPPARISLMHQAHPGLTILVYRNVAEISSGLDSARTNGWILKDSNGDEIYNKGLPQLYAIDIGNVDFQNWVAEWIKDKIDASGFDGVFADCTSALFSLGLYSGAPINPRTNNAYQDNEWNEDMIKLVKTVKSKIGDSLYVGNGLGQQHGSGWGGFWNLRSFAEPLIDLQDGILMENFMRGGDETSWLEDISFLNYVCNKGKLTISWTSINIEPEYALATYLLGKSGSRAYFGGIETFMESSSALLETDVGSPTEEYHKRMDIPVYERMFTRSLILLNPTDNSFLVPVGANYKTWDGQMVSEITVAGHTGAVLLRT